MSDWSVVVCPHATSWRGTLITANTIAFLALLTIPLAGALHRLTFMQLCVVAAAQATCAIALGAAGAAFVKAAVRPEGRARANARLETVGWSTQATGPAIGGGLVGGFGPTVTVLADAVSFLIAALLLRPVQEPAAARPARAQRLGAGREVFAGWRLIVDHAGLRALFINAMLLSPVGLLYSIASSQGECLEGDADAKRATGEATARAMTPERGSAQQALPAILHGMDCSLCGVEIEPKLIDLIEAEPTRTFLRLTDQVLPHASVLRLGSAPTGPRSGIGPHGVDKSSGKGQPAPASRRNMEPLL